LLRKKEKEHFKPQQQLLTCVHHGDFLASRLMPYCYDGLLQAAWTAAFAALHTD